MATGQVTLKRAGLRARPLSPLDVADVVEACNDPVTQRWLPLAAPYGIQDAREFIAQAHCDTQLRERDVTFAIERDEPSPGRLCGCIGLQPVSVPHRVYEIGYWVAPWSRRQQIATRAVSMLAQWAIRVQGVERLELRVQPGNTASAAVAHTCGFTREGTLRQVAFGRDGRVDLDVYSLLPMELM